MYGRKQIQECWFVQAVKQRKTKLHNLRSSLSKYFHSLLWNTPGHKHLRELLSTLHSAKNKLITLAQLMTTKYELTLTAAPYKDGQTTY